MHNYYHLTEEVRKKIQGDHLVSFLDVSLFQIKHQTQIHYLSNIEDMGLWSMPTTNKLELINNINILDQRNKT